MGIFALSPPLDCGLLLGLADQPRFEQLRVHPGLGHRGLKQIAGLEVGLPGQFERA